MVYYKHIDFLRVVFVFMVLIHHFVSKNPFKYLPFGSTIAFVLSGFLLVINLLKIKESYADYWKNTLVFLGRRFLRTLPVYWLAVFIHYVMNRHNFRDYVGYFLSFTQNYLIAYNKQPDIRPIPFGVSWSLAVQEQFYILIPIIIFVIKRKYLEQVFVLIAVLGLLLRFFYFMKGYPYLYNHFTTECCIDCFAIGGIMGYYLLFDEKRIRKIINNKALFGGVIILYVVSMLGYKFANKSSLDDGLTYLYNNLYRITERTFVSLLSVWFILWGVFNKSNLMEYLCDNLVIKYLSKISYSIYIWHLAVVWLVKNLILFFFDINVDVYNWKIIILNLFSSILFASIVYEFIEKPIQKLKNSLNYSK